MIYPDVVSYSRLKESDFSTRKLQWTVINENIWNSQELMLPTAEVIKFEIEKFNEADEVSFMAELKVYSRKDKTLIETQSVISSFDLDHAKWFCELQL